VRYPCDVVVLEGEEVAVIHAQPFSLSAHDGRRIARKAARIICDAAMAAKSGYPRFMLEETHEPPRGLAKSALPGGVEGQLAERGAACLAGPSA
jgi:glucosamine 6-phosphate synthetase-like amidotransferase/phosphosugar isomerase protein